MPRRLTLKTPRQLTLVAFDFKILNFQDLNLVNLRLNYLKIFIDLSFYDHIKVLKIFWF